MNRTAKKIAFRGRSTRGRKGVAAIEFSLTLSIWMILMLGIFDGSYYLLANEKVDRIAYTINDIITQHEETPTRDQMTDIMLAAGQLMRPISFNPETLGIQDDEGDPPAATGYIIVTSVYEDPDAGTIVAWQYAYPPDIGSGEWPPSDVGPPEAGSRAHLPNGLTLNDRDNVIVTEVFFEFSPLFLNGQFGNTRVSSEVVFKPRLSPLIEPPS